MKLHGNAPTCPKSRRLLVVVIPKLSLTTAVVRNWTVFGPRVARTLLTWRHRTAGKPAVLFSPGDWIEPATFRPLAEWRPTAVRGEGTGPRHT
jgi:hypothetical protein